MQRQPRQPHKSDARPKTDW